MKRVMWASLVGFGLAVSLGAMVGEATSSERSMGSAGLSVTPVKRGGASPQRFMLPDHGTLVLNVPATWRAALRTPPGAYPPTIGMTPVSGEKFDLVLSVSWSKTSRTDAPRPEDVRVLIEKSGKAALPQAVEKTVKVQEFGSKAKRGYYVALTHKAPRPDQFRHMTQGAIGEGNLLLGFTLLTNNPKAIDRGAVLTMLASAKQEGK